MCTMYLLDFFCYPNLLRGYIILLVQDRAGWHRSQKVNLPSGIKTEFLPAYSPELQPAERLWSLVDEALDRQRKYRKC